MIQDQKHGAAKRGEIRARVSCVIAEHFGKLKIGDIEFETHLRDDLRADSLDFAELIMKLEEEFDVPISEDDAETCTTVGDIQQLLVKLQGEVA